MRVALSRKGIYRLTIWDSPGVGLSVRHSLMEGTDTSISTQHGSVLPECWFCHQAASPLGVGRQPQQLSFKSHSGKTARTTKARPGSWEEDGQQHKIRSLSMGREWAPRKEQDTGGVFSRRQVNRSKSLTLRKSLRRKANFWENPFMWLDRRDTLHSGNGGAGKPVEKSSGSIRLLSAGSNPDLSGRMETCKCFQWKTQDLTLGI